MHGLVCSKDIEIEVKGPGVEKQVRERVLKQEEKDDVAQQLSELEKSLTWQTHDLVLKPTKSIGLTEDPYQQNVQQWVMKVHFTDIH